MNMSLDKGMDKEKKEMEEMEEMEEIEEKEKDVLVHQ